MKKIAIIVVILVSAIGAQAQKLVIGSKMPDLRGIQWISPAPASTKLIYVDFYQHSNATCRKNLEKIKVLRVAAPHIKVVILTRENNDEITALAEELGAGFSVGYDPEGKKFDDFGVKFLPFSMIFDSRSTLIWQGNITQLTAEQIKTL